MPSKVVAAVLEAAAAVIAYERENATVLAKSMTIDNKAGSDDLVICIQDVFTPSPYGTTTPTEEKVDRYKTTALQGDIITLGEQDLKGVKCLGDMKVYSLPADASCYITVGYEHE